jgi:pimeloyl-ACP methyl ester carboxylesterase
VRALPLPAPSPLRTGAEVRVTGSIGERAVALVNGGSGRDVPGTWSASLEWLVGRLAPRFPALAFLEVRFRIKSWHRLDMCAEDATAAIDVAVDGGAREVLLVGFSMGGAVAIKAAGHRDVTTVVGLAPWIPERLSLNPLRGRRLVVVHGALDRYLPGIPGVSPASSRRGFERARAVGVDGTYTLLSGAIHPIAVRGPFDRAVAMPRARQWADLVAAELDRFSS